jgi:hypothetical protein
MNAVFDLVTFVRITFDSDRLSYRCSDLFRTWGKPTLDRFSGEDVRLRRRHDRRY